MKLVITLAKHIMLKAADGKDMIVEGVSRIYLDFYEGNYERNSPSMRKQVNVIVSSSLDGNEELLLSKSSMLKMALLLVG